MILQGVLHLRTYAQRRVEADEWILRDKGEPFTAKRPKRIRPSCQQVEPVE
jgi:hypothetical protein